MEISELINKYGRKDSPYSGNLVNHLPMSQLALYKMTDDIKKVDEFSRAYKKRSNVDPVKEAYEEKESLDECLGKRESYEACLDLIKKEVKERGLKETLVFILNKYPLGVSSGLFHTIIRVAYSLEGVELDEKLDEEVERALAYYVSAYREAALLTRKISKGEIIDEARKLIEDPHIKEILEAENTRGQKIKALYEDEKFMEKGFTIEGSEKDKIEALLNLLLPIFNNTKSIVALHCITGLHASIVLREYYDDFSKLLDILTTSIWVHLLTIEEMDSSSLELEKMDDDIKNMSWNKIFDKVSDSLDAHVLKLAYTSSELYKIHEKPLLKVAALKRL